MTFEPQAFQKCINLIENAPRRDDGRMCSPYFEEKYHCSDTCPICKMDKNLYDLCMEHIAQELLSFDG